MKPIKLIAVSMLILGNSHFANAENKFGNGVLIAAQTQDISNRLVPSQSIPNVNPNFGLQNNNAQPANQGTQYAQTTDTIRVMQLEEQVRQLYGQVEELNFQMLQMQEQFRKMQEDNEFRFQELEQSGLSSDDNLVSNKIAQANGEEKRLGKPQPLKDSGVDSLSGKNTNIVDQIESSNVLQSDATVAKRKKTIDGVEIFDPLTDKSADELGAQLGANFGSVQFDANGQLVPNSNNTQIGEPTLLGPLSNDNELAQLPSDPNELYDLAYQYVQVGQYERSASAFRAFITQFPLEARMQAAQFWLGESLFSLGLYNEASETFLQNHKEFPNDKLSSQNLLKLGMSLAAMGQRELACATYSEVPKKYETLSNSLRKRIEVEQQAAKCKN
ncbi:MAG: tol-pal system protein YbgF [Nitratireductor sp.]